MVTIHLAVVRSLAYLLDDISLLLYLFLEERVLESQCYNGVHRKQLQRRHKKWQVNIFVPTQKTTGYA